MSLGCSASSDTELDVGMATVFSGLTMTLRCPSAARLGETNTREERAGLSLTAQGDSGRVGASRRGGAQDSATDCHTFCMYDTVSFARVCCMKTSLRGGGGAGGKGGGGGGGGGTV